MTKDPSIAIEVTRKLDPDFRWDGDGPDPVEDGFDAYDVWVVAHKIVDGTLYRGFAYLGGSYFQPSEAIGDVHGYLPQLTEEAVADLKDKIRLGIIMQGR